MPSESSDYSVTMLAPMPPLDPAHVSVCEITPMIVTACDAALENTYVPLSLKTYENVDTGYF